MTRRLDDLLRLEAQVTRAIAAERDRLGLSTPRRPLNHRIRVWAAANGYRIGPTGPIPKAVRRAWLDQNR